ncbi:MAG TPA: hypothetical protein PKM57_05405 [Kiritimatiellia bacterium]|nr:hypothetical protein [Kiritimatiellia bacterium]HPS06506.1 hypothetical protein [Kiritimatiellia bacterium]
MRTPRIRLYFGAIAILCLLTLMLLRPSGMSGPVFQRTVDRRAGSATGAWEADFEIRDALPRLCVQTRFEKKAGRLHLDCVDKNGAPLFSNFLITPGVKSFSCGSNVQGTYTLRVREDGVSGWYRIEAASRAGVTRWQKSMAFLLSLLALSAGVEAWQVRRRRRGLAAPAYVSARIARLFLGLGLFILFVYLLLHEGGHALASMAFGSFDLQRSDFFGLSGSPHSGIKPWVKLPAWQGAVQSAAGPLLPILTGYALFAFWRSRRGTALRSRRFIVDVFWSFTLATLLVSPLGLVLPMIGAISDSDYSGFANAGWLTRWQADGLVLACVLINGYLFWRVFPALVTIRRRLQTGLAQEEDLRCA